MSRLLSKERVRDLLLGLALLCATLHEPPVLFLDEPTSGVDARTRRDFWKHITAMTEAGASVLVTTHFMEEAEYCDRMALIYRGAMISMGTRSRPPAGAWRACPTTPRWRMPSSPASGAMMPSTRSRGWRMRLSGKGCPAFLALS